ncbi:glutamate/gamma-aminobutyrate family transporter YjeM [Peptostreptococcaceae bacterium AGR-M142]
MSDNNKKLTLTSLILMIFTSVFGFGNVPRSFYLMGYGAIVWFLVAAVLFFIPYAFMMAEYGAAFKDEKGGIYSWMEKSVGPKFAFIGTFMWYASYVVWMVSIVSSIWITFSTAIFGKDLTSTWSLFGLGSTQTLGILGCIMMTVVTIVGSKGLKNISKITSVGGTAVALLNVVFIVGSFIVLILNKGQVAEPITAAGFTFSPNPDYQSSVGAISFMVFAIFGYGGLEAVGGLVDQTENAEKTFPKGIAISAVIISIGYAFTIFLCGFFLNWNTMLSGKDVHMGNITYVAVQHLGYVLGSSFGLNEAISVQMGLWMSRFVALSMFISLIGAFFTLTYSPLKQLIEGTPKEIWGKKITTLKDGMPVNAMYMQCAIVVLMVLGISMGGDNASAFFAKIILMTNVAMTIPYMFLASAFIKFKNNNNIHKPFEVYKSKSFSKIAAIVVTLVVGGANLFTVLSPCLKGRYVDALWMVGGPIFFTIVAFLLYASYENKTLKNKRKDIA